ncbi:MAG: glycine cleavage system protein H [Planctomycetaceae bacterium]|nr:MAG: glycine cleavage system protein H [Planctomycetaceae bacterium]
MAATDELVFMMGQYPARIPLDRLYSPSHFWLKAEGSVFRVGFTAYSVRLLQDVYFLSWSIDGETTVRKKQEIGEIESSKAVSTLYAPCDGRILRFNERVASDPTPINTDNYGTGWLYELETSDPLLSGADYVAVLEAGWEQTQRMIKGQMNE